jgi:hypothetical protein
MPTNHQYVCYKSFGGHKNNHLLCISKYFLYKFSMMNNFLGWCYGIVFSLIALINIFWGNDILFGVFYIPTISDLIALKTGIRLPLWSKIAIALFIIWSSVGVGELFEKIDMMLQSFQ